MLDHRKRQEELAAHIQELLDEIADQKETHQRLQQEYTTAVQTHEDEMRKQRREFDAKDSALQSALGDLTRKEAEVRRVQGTYEELKKAHSDAQSRGNEKTGERYSLQLEIDRLTRDVQRLEDDLRRARKDLEDREGKIRERDGTLDQLYVEVRELKSAVAAQTQARLNIAEKLDGAQSSVKSLENELSVAKHRLAESEAELSRAQRGVIGTENQYRDQVTERNTLLLTIYQYIEKTIGVDKFGVRLLSSRQSHIS
jgi:chromosome segregation ATPase